MLAMTHALDTKAAGLTVDGGALTPVGGLAKRTADIVIASLSLMLLWPLMLLVAIAIGLTMGTPVVFKQRRVGFNGQVFACCKFRTMRSDADEVLAACLARDPDAAAEWRSTKKLKHDPRVTPLGLWLRRMSIDELPQLLNILKGDMSCVGPRPVVPDELALYGGNVAEYLRVRPGLTGLWQVGGRSDVTYAARVKLDCQYVRNWSIAMDCSIILKTIPAVISARGSY
jgi:exopolysaccharide production protein ExoY